MDGNEAAPGSVQAVGLAGWTLSNISEPILTGISIALLLYYIVSRFLWLYDKVVDIAEEPTTTSPSSSPRAPSSPPPISQPRHAVLLSLLPVFVPMSSSIECAVCLAELGQRQAGRLLPRCGHAFHDECIMMWLKLNMTCPLCRAVVATK